MSNDRDLQRISSTAADLALTLPSLLDSVVRDRVLVFGSLPPRGHDLDLLARSSEHTVLAERLKAYGFVCQGFKWAWFGDCGAYGVELVRAETWRLPLGEQNALFHEARPLPGMRYLVRPAPHHTLLLVAGRFARSHGHLDEKARARIDRALHEDADAWAVARERAPLWKRSRELNALAHALHGSSYSPPSWQRTIGMRRPLRGRPYLVGIRWLARRLRSSARHALRGSTIVAFSGLDGSGKTSQAVLLKETLAHLGETATVAWVPFGSSSLLAFLRRIARRWLPRFRRPVSAPPQENALAETGSEQAPVHGTKADAPRVLLVPWVMFVTVVALAQLWMLTLRCRFKPEIVILDRFVLDSAVKLDYWYSDGVRIRIHKWLFSRLSPRATCAFYLDVRPETAFLRKTDQWKLDDLRRQAYIYRGSWKNLGVRHLDGERPVCELSAEIARETWAKLK